MNTASAAELPGRCGPAAERLFRESAAGKVCGVFSSALYCDFGKEILLFHGSAYGEVPFGVALDDIQSFLGGCKAEVGDAAILCAHDFSLGAQSYLLRQGAGRPPRQTGVLLPPGAERLDTLYTFIRENGSPHGILSLLETDAATKAALPALESAFCMGDAGAASDAALRLIGRGRGLTPSGDDFLCGFFQTLYAARKAEIAVPEITETCAAAVSGALARTSQISGAYLRHALAGSYFTVYDVAVHAVLGDSDFDKACRFVFTMGASSGTDTLLGALAAARVLSASHRGSRGYIS